MKLSKLIGVIFFAGLLTACGTSQDTSLYYSGNYSDVIHNYYSDDVDYAKQEESLQKIITEAQARNKKVAPGVYGHLGLVQLKQGKHTDAAAAFEQEKALYPDSAMFINFLQKKSK